MRLTTLTLCLALATACSRSPTGPTPPVPGTGPNTGTWAGTVADSLNGQGSVRVALEETPFGGTGLLGGTWAVTYADASRNAGGEVSGGITGATVVLTLRRSVPLACPTAGPVLVPAGSFQAFGLSLAGRTMAGAYDFLTCTGTVAGTLTLTKQ
jgi:hypothetical protein